MEFNLWPNPNNGDRLFISLNDHSANVLVARIEIIDLQGRTVLSDRIEFVDGSARTVIALDPSMAAGIYTVRILAGERIHSSRLAIQR